MKSFLAVCVVLLASTAPSLAASQYDLPPDGTEMKCRLAPLGAPGTAYFVQCEELYAGTIIATKNGGYSGPLVCKHMVPGVKCGEVVTARIDTAAAGPLGAYMVCTVKGSMRDEGSLFFSCAP